MTRAAKATLIAAILASSITIWGVHYMQRQERETMYKGVLRDDVRRKEKHTRREEELRESLRKQDDYLRVQKLPQAPSSHSLCSVADSETRPPTSPEPLQIMTPPPPFNSPHADVILRSADGVDYRVMKAIMAEASPVFRNLLSLPQPDAIREEHNAMSLKNELPLVKLTERSEVLDALLREIYPIVSPQLKDLKLIYDVFGAARKYDMEWMIQNMRKALRAPEFCEGEPALKVYVIACRYKLKEEARKAAKDLLEGPYPLPYLPEMENTSVLAYHRLLNYRTQVTAAVLRLFTLSLSNVSAFGPPSTSRTPSASGPPSIFRTLPVSTPTFALGTSSAFRPPSTDVPPSDLQGLIRCPGRCASTRFGTCPNQTDTELAGAWWAHYRERVKKRLREAPMTTDIFTWQFLAPSFTVAESCIDCRKELNSRWPQLSEALRAKRDATVSSVVFDLAWS